jgi:transposase
VPGGEAVCIGDAMWASIVPLAASGMTNLAIAAQLRTTRVTEALWRRRFATRRMDGLSDEPRPVGPRKIRDDRITEVVTVTLETMPAAAIHWSTSLWRKPPACRPPAFRIW